jgi:hypothetical protein
VLNWLLTIPEYTFDWKTSLNAARGGHIHVLKYLAAKSIAIDVTACVAVAYQGAMHILEWLDEIGVNWKHQSVYTAAAESGSLEMILWFTERGAKFKVETMAAAAQSGHLNICKHLHTQGCGWDYSVTHAAKTVEILKWLHENGCPLEVDWMLLTIVDKKLRQYIIAGTDSYVTISKLSELLNIAGIECNEYIGTALRAEGAEWPTVLQCSTIVWRPEMIEWARSQGCTSPTS